MEIPKDYFRVAESPFMYNKATAYYNKDTLSFIIVVDEDVSIGPINKAQLEVLSHVIKDLIEMRGRYGAI